MGTRSTYRVIETWKDDTGKEKKQNICLLYLQYDGYPEGHPLQTAEWLNSGKVVNGLGINDKDKLVFNGAGCLAAQLVTLHKEGPGGAYLHPMNHRTKCWENYTYDIIVNSETKEIKMIAYEVHKGARKIFEGSPKQFIEKYGKE